MNIKAKTQSKKRKADDKKESEPRKKSQVADTNTTRSAQKRQVKQERQSQRRHASVVLEAKSIWNSLRLKTNTKEQCTEWTNKLMDLIQGKAHEIALQHDASRVIQAAIQFGTLEQRKIILKELIAGEGSLPELAKIQYASFCCLKLIKYLEKDKEAVRDIVKAFKGTIPRLAVHGVAGRVVESLFVTLPPKSTAELKQEFYGPHFSLFASDNVQKNGKVVVPTLQSNLQLAKTDQQRKSAIDFAKDIVQKGITKSFFGHSYWQELCCECMMEMDGSEIRDILPGLVDHALHILSTRSGTKVVAACASYSTPKDRKRLLKSLKGFARSSLLHRDAYLAILRLIQVTDDTVSVNKFLLSELLSREDGNEESGESPLLELALNNNASKLFLMLLVEDDEQRSKYFDPYERQILDVEATIKENGEDVPTSKKDAPVRRKELQGYIQEQLVAMCSKHTEELMRSLPGSRVLKEVYACFVPDDVVSSIVDVCKSACELLDDDANASNDLSPLFEDPVAHRLIKNLFLHDAKSPSDECKFSKSFLDDLAEDLVAIASSNRGAFVVSALCEVKAVQAEVRAKLKSKIDNFQKLSKKSSGPTAGFAALLKAIK